MALLRGCSVAARVLSPLSLVSRAPSLPGRLLPCVLSRRACHALANFDHKDWSTHFLDAVKDVPSATDPAQSADVLRSLVKTNLLSFTDMRDDLAKEKMSMERIWKKREKQLDMVLTNTSLMYGSVQGIAGPEVKDIELLELGGPDED